MNLPLRTLLLIAIPSCLAPLTAQVASPSTTLTGAGVLKPLPASRVLAYKEIAGDFASNEVAALAKYSNKRITVIGHVSSLSQGSSENKILIVTMQGASGALPAVKAEFLFGSIPQNSEIQISTDGSSAILIHRDRSGNILGQEPYMSVDQRVGITGSVKGLDVGTIVLTDCKRLSKQKFHSLLKVMGE